MDEKNEAPTGPSVAIAEPASRNAQALVASMIEAGEWPEPDLMQQIVDAGDAAIEPLIAILRSKPCGWPAEAPLHHALGLLEVLRPPAAIPDLIEILKSYPDDAGEDAANAIVVHGETVFEQLLELAGDPTQGDDARNHAITAAKKVAGANPTLRTQLAGLLRPMLAEAIEEARRRIAELADEPDSDEFDEFDPGPEPENQSIDEDSGPDLAGNLAEIETDDDSSQGEDELAEVGDLKQPDKNPERNLAGQILYRVAELAGLADPLARDLIKTAYAENLVETFFLGEQNAEDLYRRGGDSLWEPPDWLGDYRDAYKSYFERLNQPAQLPKLSLPRIIQEPPAPPRQSAMPASIRNVAPKVGRNDPCWCGSGKKYKKCHLGNERPA